MNCYTGRIKNEIYLMSSSFKITFNQIRILLYNLFYLYIYIYETAGIILTTLDAIQQNVYTFIYLPLQPL